MYELDGLQIRGEKRWVDFWQAGGGLDRKRALKSTGVRCGHNELTLGLLNQNSEQARAEKQVLGWRASKRSLHPLTIKTRVSEPSSP